MFYLQVKMELFKAEREEVLILLERVSEAQRLATMQMKESEGGQRGGGRKRQRGDGEGGDEGSRGSKQRGGRGGGKGGVRK
jgi:ATP-dependent RNA helicase DDX47/RRP3